MEGMGSNLYVGLVHHPIYDKRREIVATAVTNFDVHDIARCAKTFDLGGFFIITPLESQVYLVKRLIRHWVEDAGTQARAHPELIEAVAWVRAGNLGKIRYARGTCYKPRMSIGKVGKHCQNCTTETPWSYAEGRVPPTHVVEQAARNSSIGESSWMTSVMGPIGRSHRRVIMQVPLGVRDSRGSAEVTRTENISKCGFCFTSDKRYLPGEIIMSVFPLDPVTRKTELPARIVREQCIEGSGRKFYGATFEALSAPRPMVA